MEKFHHTPDLLESAANDVLAKDYKRVMSIGNLVQEEHHELYNNKNQDNVLPELIEIEELVSEQRVEFAVQQEMKMEQQKLEKMKLNLCKRYAAKISRLDAEENRRTELMEQLIVNACTNKIWILEHANPLLTLEFTEGPINFEDTDKLLVCQLSTELQNFNKQYVADYGKGRQETQYMKLTNRFWAQVVEFFSLIAKYLEDSMCDDLRPMCQQILALIKGPKEFPTQKLANLQDVLKAKLEIKSDLNIGEDPKPSEHSFICAIFDNARLEVTDPCYEKNIKLCQIRQFESPPSEIKVEWVGKTHDILRDDSFDIATLILKELRQVVLDDQEQVRKAVESVLVTSSANIPGSENVNKHYIDAFDSLEVIKCPRYTKSEDPMHVNNLIGISDSMELIQKSFEPTSASHETNN